MKIHLSLALASSLLQTPTAPVQQRDLGKASIEGVITSSGSGQPLERAQVQLIRIVAPPQAAAPAVPPTPPVPIPPVVTVNDGKFIFEAEPGQYRLRVQRNGFATQEYGQRVIAGPGTVINLSAGQAMKDVTFKMIAGGVVTGRVRDSKGDPVAGVQVSLMRSVYNTFGQRTLTTSGGGTTDDRGEYRIFWVPPGRYVLSVSSASTTIIVLVFNQNVLADRIFPTTYYPGTTDASRAVTLEVQPGNELTGIDIVVNPPVSYRVRGRLVDSATGQPPKTASVTLSPRQQTETTGIVFSSSIGNTTTYNPNGTFEIRNVIPGSYWLRAQMANNLNDPINPSVVANVRSGNELLETVLGTRSAAQIPLDVVAGDVENLAVTLTPGINIPMTLTVEGQELTSIGGYENIRIYLRPAALNAPTAAQRSAFNADGTSVLSNVPPGEYRIQGLSFPPDLYLKEVRFDRTDVLNDSWQITNATSGTLTVLLSNKAGQVEGTLTDVSSRPVSGNQVLLIPDQNRDRSDLFKSASTDQNGHFVFRGIPPGGYRVYSWEAIEPNAWYDPDVLTRNEPLGKPVRIQEMSRETVDVKIIPAPKQ